MAMLLGFGAVLALTASASAAGRAAALVPQIRPTAAPEVRDRFHEAVTRGLQTGGDEIVPAAEVRLRLGLSEEMLNCGGGACVARAAQALRIDRIVATDIDVSGKDYAIKLRLLDAVGRELAKADEPCDICTVKEADEALARAATKIAAAARALPGETPPTPRTETPPPPPKAEAPPPPAPKLEPPPLPKADVPPQASEPTTTALMRPEKRGFPWRPVAIASLAVGLVGIVSGIPLLAIDGQPTCNLPNPKQACPDVYNTVGGGAALLTIGLAGVAASGALFYLDHRARTKARPTVMVVPMPGGAFLTTGGRF